MRRMQTPSLSFPLALIHRPFCATTNQLMVELPIYTSKSDDQPVLFDDTGRPGSFVGAHTHTMCVCGGG